MNAPPRVPEESQADIFISHASEDKSIARPLAEALRRRGLTVWYDEYVLRLGDSLREVIDRGLASARFGVVILSPHFFAKEWPQRELNGFLARETLNRKKVLLPVWHELSHEEVARHSPVLADRLAVSTNRGIEHVVEQILEVLEADGPRVARAAPAASHGAPAGQAVPSKGAAVATSTIAKAPVAQAPVAKRRSAKVPAFKTSPVKTPRRLVARPLAIAAGSLMIVGITAGVLLTDRGKQAPLETLTDAAEPAKPDPGLSVGEVLGDYYGERNAVLGMVAVQRAGDPPLREVWEAVPDLLWLNSLSDKKGILTLEGRAFSTNAIASFIENLDRIQSLGEPSLADRAEFQDGAYRFTVRVEHERAQPPNLNDTWEEEYRYQEILQKLPSPESMPAVLDFVRLTIKEDLRLLHFWPRTSEGTGLIEFKPVEVHMIGSFREIMILFDQLKEISSLVGLTELSLSTWGSEDFGTLSCTFRLLIPFSKLGMRSEISNADLSDFHRVPLLLRSPFQRPKSRVQPVR